MKKLLAILTAMTMALSLAACGGDDGSVDEGKTSGGDAVDYSQFLAGDGVFPILDRYDVFPSPDYWTALGLPDDFTIEIIEMKFSDTDSIYPQDFEEGNLFDCKVADNKAAYAALADALWNAGINGRPADGGVAPADSREEIDLYDIDAHEYQAYWLLDGKRMSIALRARDGSDQISVTVKYLPEDAA